MLQVRYVPVSLSISPNHAISQATLAFLASFSWGKRIRDAGGDKIFGKLAPLRWHDKSCDKTCNSPWHLPGQHFFSRCICTCTLHFQLQLGLCAKQPIDLPNMVKRKADNQTKSDSKKGAKNLKRTKNSNASPTRSPCSPGFQLWLTRITAYSSLPRRHQGPFPQGTLRSKRP